MGSTAVTGASTTDVWDCALAQLVINTLQTASVVVETFTMTTPYGNDYSYEGNALSLNGS
jgi:hypothetical protein